MLRIYSRKGLWKGEKPVKGTERAIHPDYNITFSLLMSKCVGRIYSGYPICIPSAQFSPALVSRERIS